MKKKIIILGSTGSIGRSTIEILENKKNYFDIQLLSTNTNIELAVKQAKKFSVKHIIISDYETFLKAKKKYYKSKINFYNKYYLLEGIK